MKKLSKKIISLMLALIMAMPIVFAVPSTASAESSRAATEETVLFWDFTEGAKILNDGSDYFPASVSRASNNKLRTQIYGSNTYTYKSQYNGLTSEDGFLFYEGLASALDSSKDVTIKIRLDFGGKLDADHGVFAIGSARGSSNGEASFNDVVYMKNDGKVYYRGDGGSTNIGSTSITTSTKYTFEIYFKNSTKELFIKKDGTQIAYKQDAANLTVSDFNFFAVSVWQNTYYGNTTTEYIEVSQPMDYAAVAKAKIGSIASQENRHVKNLVMYDESVSGEGKVDSNVAYVYDNGTQNTSFFDSDATESNLGSNLKVKTKFFVSAERVVFLYTGDTSKIKLPIITEIDNSGDTSKYAMNYIAPDNSDWKCTSNWLKCGTNEQWRQWNRNNPSGSFDGITNVGYNTSHSDFSGSSSDGTEDQLYLSNFIYYNGSISNYVTKIATPTFKISFDAYKKPKCGDNTVVNNSVVSGLQLGVNQNFNFSYRALNYVPMKNAIATITGSDFTTLFNNVKNNEWMYDETSLNEFYKGVAMMASFDLANYDMSADGGLYAAASDMEDAITQFNAHKTEPTKKNFTITYVDKNGTSTTATVQAGKTLAEKTSGASVPSTPATVTTNNGYHNTYSWSSTGVYGGTSTTAPSGSHKPRSNETYTVVTTPVACTYDDGTAVASDGSTHNGYTPQVCTVCGYEDQTQRAFNALDWDTYDAKLSDYTTAMASSSTYTTSTVSACTTAVEAAQLVKAEHDGSNTPQATVDAAANAIDTAVKALEGKASFTALETARNNAIDALDAAASANTTSSVSAARTYLNNSTEFPYEYTADRDNTGVSHNDAIAAEAAKFGNWQTASPLEAKASFTALDNAKNAAIDELDEMASGYTTSSVSAARTYLTSSAQFPYEYSADRNDTGVSKDGEIATEATKFANWKTAKPLDKLADLTYLEAEYDKANTFLVNLDGKAAEYTAESVQDLIDAIKSDTVTGGTGNTAEDIVTASAAAKADFGQAVQADIAPLADGIREAFAGLETVETVATGVDTSTLEAALIQINNVDPDAYNIESGSISSAQAGVNALISSELTTKDYNGATISVLNGSVTQQQVNDAVNAIETALTVSTKSYAINKSAEGDTSFEISARNGKYEGGFATYGTTIICDSGDSETAWYLEIQTGSMHKKMAFQGYGQKLSTKVLGTTTVKAVKKATGQKRVKILRKYGDAAITDKSPVQFVDYLASGETFTFPAAPAIAFYTFDKYYIGETPHEAGDEITITEDTDIIARYTANADADCAINAKDVSGASHNSTVAYNTKVELEGGSGTYAWIEAVDSTGTNFRPFYIGENVSFFASESTNLKAVTKSQFDAYKFNLPAVNLRKSGVNVVNGRTTFNGQIVPGNANVKEYGILIAAPVGGATINPSIVVIENSGNHSADGYKILRAKSTKLVGANQFSISVNSIPDGYVYRGYLIYEDAEGLHNVYSEAMR